MSTSAASLTSRGVSALSATRKQALKEQQARPQQGHSTSEQDVHFRLREFHPRPVLGWRGCMSAKSWS